VSVLNAGPAGRRIHRPLWRHRSTEILVLGSVGSGQDEWRSGFEIEDLVARVEDDAAGTGSLHDVDRTVQRHGPANEVQDHDEMVVLVQREAGDTVDVIRPVNDVLDRSDRLSRGIQPHLAAKSTKSSLNVQAGLNAEQSIVSDRAPSALRSG
jgi:hypothetical protein